jgi:hypothetical protein
MTLDMKHFFLYASLIALTLCGTAISVPQSASAQTAQTKTQTKTQTQTQTQAQSTKSKAAKAKAKSKSKSKSSAKASQSQIPVQTLDTPATAPAPDITGQAQSQNAQNAQNAQSTPNAQNATLFPPLDPKYDKFDSVVLLDSTSVNVLSNGSGTFTYTRRIKYLTPNGAKSGRVITYGYDPLTAYARFTAARIIHSDNTITPIDLTTATDYAAPAHLIYWGSREILLEPGLLRKGDVLEYTIEKKGFTYALLTDSEFASSNFEAVSPEVNATLSSSPAPEVNATFSASPASEANFLLAGYPAPETTPAPAGAPDPQAQPATLYSYQIPFTPDADDASRFVPPMEGSFYDIVPLWVGTPTLRLVYAVTYPKGMTLLHNIYNDYAQESESSDSQTGATTLTISKTDVLPLVSDPKGQVDWYDCGPMLLVSSTPKWEAKSQWFYQVNEDYGSFKAYAPAQQKVNEIIKGKKTEMEKISALTHWVADNIHYDGLSMGKGEGYTLHSCEMDYNDRCGVCKDIAGTLISFLRMAGFNAYPAMTMAGSKIYRDVPVDHFNHCVVVCKLSDGTYMPLDPTWVPFTRELWSSAEQQQNYLPGIPEGSDLRETPLSAPENQYLKINAKSSLDKSGTLRGTVTYTAEGQTDRSIRRIFCTGWQSQWKAEMERQLLAVSPRAILKKVDWGRDPKDYQSGPIKITLTFEIPQYAVLGVSGELLFKPFSLNNFLTPFKTYLSIDRTPETRKYGFKDQCSRQLLIDETISLPGGYQLVGGSKSVSDSGPAASFSGTLVPKGNRIELKQQLNLNKRVYDASDWPSFRLAVSDSESFNAYLSAKK